MKFTNIPVTAMDNIQLNAGMLLSEFDISTRTLDRSKQIGATTGGVNFTATPTTSDYGADIDNCPTNVLELKRLDSWDVTMGGTFISANTATAKYLVGAAGLDTSISGVDHIQPRNDLEVADFQDIWWVGDYSTKNGDTNGGGIAIKLHNALSTGGFQIQSTNKGKGQFAFTFTGHYSINAQDTPPFDIYIWEGTDEPSPEPPTPTTYTVTNTLTHVVNSNEATSVTAEAAYSATLSAEEGYSLAESGASVEVTMGGTDITATAYTAETGAVAIASVTGNIVITAVAVESL